MAKVKKIYNSEERKAYWAKRKDYINSVTRTTLTARYKTLVARCKREGRKLKLSFERYKDIINAGCHYCGNSLLGVVGANIDRANNSNRNYTGKLVGCCSDCNKIKSDRLTYNEMLVAMKAVNKYRKLKEDN